MAGRIPDAFIQDLIARSDIVEVIGARLELKRAGREYKARSPFTNEKSPSFFVNPAKQMFFDFSSGKNGTVITFLMEHDRLSFVEAVEELAQRAGVEVPREGGESAHVVLEGPLDALAAAQRFFRDQLKTAPQAIEYLKQRGVNGETAKLFGIGFAPEGWSGLSDFLKETQHALDAGLLKKKEGTSRVYDVFRNRIMFPIRDTRGRVIAFGGRTMANDPAKYLNSPETALFHKGRNLYGLYEARQSSKTALPYLIVVEGYMDVVMLAQYGIHEVVATLGTATTREHLNLLFKSTSKIVFCFDGDRAGRTAATRAMDQILPELFDQRECVFMFIPAGHDPDTWVREIGTIKFREYLYQAMPAVDYLMGELAAQVNISNYSGKAKLLELAKPFLSRMREGPLQSSVLEKLYRLTGYTEETFKKNVGNLVAAPMTPGLVDTGVEGGVRTVKRAMQLLLEKPVLADQVQHLELLAQAQAPGVSLLVEAIDFFHTHPAAKAAQLSEFWRDSPKKAAAVQRLLQEGIQLVESAMEREFLDAIQRLGQQVFKARVQNLLAESTARELTPAEKQEINSLARRGKAP